MSDVDDLLSRLPIGDIAAQLGVDEASAQAAAAQAVPALLTGLQTQTRDENSAQQLAHALQQHDNDLADGEIDLGQVDTADGTKIVLPGDEQSASNDEPSQARGAKFSQ